MSNQFYQNVHMDQLKTTISDSKADDNRNSFKWSDVTSNPGRKAILIGIFLIVLCYFSGILQLLSYSASIFKETGSSSGSTISPNTSFHRFWVLYDSLAR